MIMRILTIQQILSMVYIKLRTNLFQQLKSFVQADKLVLCKNEYYLAYPQFKKISQKYNLEIHKQIGRNDIITYNQMETLLEKNKQTAEQTRYFDQLKCKRQLRLIKNINSNSNTQNYYFQNEKDKEGVKQITESISFSMAFIFSFFMAGLTGYYFGTYFLNWSLARSLMISLVFIIATIVIETTLFIIKQSKNESKRPRKKYRDEYDRSLDRKTRQNQKSIFEKKHN